MLTYSFWMTLVVVSGVVAMALFSKKVGGGSAKYFMQQQKAMGKAEGFVQEMMSGQKVIKVFCHEKECNKDINKIIAISDKQILVASVKSGATLEIAVFSIYSSPSAKFSVFSGMSKGHPDLECETKFRIPEITFACSGREIPACALLFYFSNSGVSVTSSGAMSLHPVADSSCSSRSS